MIPHFVRAPARVHILLPISFLFDIKPLNNQRCYKVFTTELTEITEGEFLCELGGFLLFYLRCWHRLFCNTYR